MQKHTYNKKGTIYIHYILGIYKNMFKFERLFGLILMLLSWLIYKICFSSFS